MARTTLGVALLAAAFVFFLTTVALGAASTALQDWIYMGPDGSHYLHEGLWSTCWGNHCFPIGHYFLTCQTILDTVRAFSIMTIIFAFLTLTAIFMLLLIDITWFWILVLILALITVCCSIVPWTVYFAFTGADAGCAIVFSKGAGWALAVAAFPVATVGLILVLLWVCLGRPPAAPPVPPHMHISGDRSNMGVWLLGVSAFFFMVEWVLSTAAACSTNWATLNVKAVHEGLWQTCTGTSCDPITSYTGQCLAFLNTTRAFNILTILFGFFAMVAVILMLFLTTPFLWIIALVLGILAVLVAVLPWTVYGLGTYGIGLFSNCVPGYLQPGGGWALAVASFVMGAVGLALLVAWLIVGTRRGFLAPAVAPKRAPEGFPYYQASPEAYAALASPFPAQPAVNYSLNPTHWPAHESVYPSAYPPAQPA